MKTDKQILAELILIFGTLDADMASLLECAEKLKLEREENTRLRAALKVAVDELSDLGHRFYGRCGEGCIEAAEKLRKVLSD